MVPSLIERSAYKYTFSLLKGGMVLLEEILLYTVMNGLYLDYQWLLITEHITSIVASMMKNCQATQRQRLVNKYTENDHEKVMSKICTIKFNIPVLFISLFYCKRRINDSY
jgi:hypothetical protein